MNIVDIAVKRPVTVWMFTLAICLFGMVSLSRLDVSLLPELSYPTLTVRTDYPGAAPAEVEQLVTKRIEESVSIVKGVRRVTSSSKAGQSDVVLEFEWGTDMDFASVKVREKLDSTWLPLDIKKPVVLRFNPSLAPIMRYGLSNLGSAPISLSAQNSEPKPKQPALSDLSKATRLYAEEQIKRKLESVAGVASVKVGGGLENEIHVLVDQQKISQLKLSIEQIIQRLKAENVNVSGGRVKDGDQEYLVRTINQFEHLDQIRELFIAHSQGKNIRLGDVASVVEAHKDAKAITRFDLSEGVEIAIYKEGDANSVEVARAVRKRIEQLNKTLPSNLTLQLNYDQSTFISQAISEVKSAAIFGGLLAMLVLYLFLKNVWPTVVVSISIPVSIIATFNLMYNNDISLNIMSLGGIALAIGLLVDNSIVVLENIARHKTQNADFKQAAANGTKQVSMAIVASTLTSMAVFFPLVFVEGIAGQLFRDQALTVTFALAASLLVALTLIPMLAAREKTSRSTKQALPARQGEPANTQLAPEPKVTKPSHPVVRYPKKLMAGLGSMFYHVFLFIVSSGYLVFNLVSKLLKWLLAPFVWLFDTFMKHAEILYLAALKTVLKARVTSVLMVMTLSASSLLLLPKIDIELIPDMAQGEFFVEVKLASGSQLVHTDTLLFELADYTQKLEGVSRTYSLAGSGTLVNASANQGGEHWGKLNVVMNEKASAQTKQQVQQSMREYLAQQAGVQSQFGQPDLFTFATPLEIQLYSYDLDTLLIYSQKIQEKLQTDPRFADVSAKLQGGNPELKIEFDHNKLAQLGLSAPNVSRLIAAKIGGELAGKFSIQDRRVDIVVKAPLGQRNSIPDIGKMIVNPNAPHPVSLDSVANLSMGIGPSEISRIEQQRVAVINANLNFGGLGEATQAADALLSEMVLPADTRYKVAGQSDEMQRSFTSLQLALALAIFLVYIIMASQFESLLHPLLILFTVPLACAGSIFGLFATQTYISVVVFIGLIMLAGIVVNNAIVLIDRINQMRAQGLNKHQAIIESAKGRLRPILMTTLTTSLGLLPMAIGIGEGAEMRAPMAITVIFGLLFATLLTLLFIPAIYSLLDRKRFVPPTKLEQASENTHE